MATESNKPMQRVHNGGDGIWDGAGWGLVAGASAMGAAYGAGVHGAKHLQNLNTSMVGKRQGKMYEDNVRRAAFGKRYHSDAALQTKALKMENRAAGINKMLGGVRAGGDFAFGSGKRAIVSGATGLLGGMMAGAGIDHINK